jgi:RNA polymerase sigma-70 factor, ECF subfamily
VAVDPKLVARLRQGDADAFDDAYELYRARLYSFLLRLSRDRALAHDLLQEMWLRLARHATRLDAGTDLAAWLFTVARNLLASHRRWLLLDRQRLEALHAWPRGAPPVPEELAVAGQTARRLEAAIAALPLKYREALLLVAVERLDPGQAATVLGLKPDALRQRLSRARGMIAEALAKDVREPR